MNPLFKIPQKKEPKIEIYDTYNAYTKSSQWRWRITVSSDIVAASTESYYNRKDCIDNLLSLENYIRQLREKDMIK